MTHIAKQAINCNCIAQPVKYDTSKIEFVETSSLGEFEPLVERVNEALFRKTNKDKEQQEYRIAFILFNKSLGALSVKKEAIYLPTNPLFDVLKTEVLT